MNLILFGFKKCGKSYYGLRVAQKMHMSFVETDLMIEELYASRFHNALSCREIVSHHGEHLFRELEKQVLYSLNEVKNTVIALGGGSVLDAENVEHLTKVGPLVYLQTDKHELRRRLFVGELPYYIDPDDPLHSFEKMYEVRHKIYEQIPAFKIDTHHKNETQIIHELCALVETMKGFNGQ
ncbi:MAG: hypothetical protein EBZ47_03340 [Chlamydiae bacterium]|nr:hypothetical protein [Chlamydiota bacterium]